MGIYNGDFYKSIRHKENIERFNKKYKCNFDSPAHTSKHNLNLINKFFEENDIQNPPNSPDLAYPIENIWAYLKRKMKNKQPKTIDELIKYTIQICNSIPKKIIKRYFTNYIERLNG